MQCVSSRLRNFRRPSAFTGVPWWGLAWWNVWRTCQKKKKSAHLFLLIVPEIWRGHIVDKKRGKCISSLQDQYYFSNAGYGHGWEDDHSVWPNYVISTNLSASHFTQDLATVAELNSCIQTADHMFAVCQGSLSSPTLTLCLMDYSSWGFYGDVYLIWRGFPHFGPHNRGYIDAFLFCARMALLLWQSEPPQVPIVSNKSSDW